MARKKPTTPTGAAITYGRSLKGWTRDEAVARLGDGWSVTKLANYELGRTDPTISQARQLAAILDLPINAIVYGIHEAGPVTNRYRPGREVAGHAAILASPLAASAA